MARFCGGCGTRLEDGAAFCPSCGTPAGAAPAAPRPAAPPPYPPQAAAPYPQSFTIGSGQRQAYGGGAPNGDPAVWSAIGSNANFYLGKWSAMDARGSTTSWNWAALFLNGFWLAYRKMWGPALVYFLLIIAFTAAVTALLATKTVEVEVAYALTMLSVLPALYVAAKGNHLYRLHVHRILAETGAAHYDPAALERARQRGGTSLASAIGAYMMWSVIVGGTYFYLVNETDLLDGLMEELDAGPRRNASFGFDGAVSGALGGEAPDAQAEPRTEGGIDAAF